MAESNASKVAQRRIDETRQSKAEELDLSADTFENKEQLTELPDSLGTLTHLKRLKLSGNRLTVLPDSIGQLAQLESLIVANTQLTKLPESLGLLTKLEVLDLSENKLTEFPSSLAQLAELRSLDLDANKFTAVPEFIQHLGKLKSLNLSANNLVTLPGWLAKLTQLEALYLSATKLTAVPDWVRELTELKSLGLSENRLVALPEWLSASAKLEWLNLEGNQLVRLPESLSNLPNLLSLFLGRNRLSLLPDWLGRLSRIRRISLRGNPLTSFTESFTQGVSNIAILKEAGKVFYDRWQYDACFRSFCRVLDIDSQDPDALFWRCLALRLAKRYPEAQQAIDEGLSLLPGNLLLLVERAFVYYDSKEYQRALASFDDVLRIDNKSEDALLWRVACLRQLRSFEKAKQELDAALALLPGNPALLEEQVRLAFEQNKFDEALECVDKVLSQHGDRVSAGLLKADALSGLNRETEALDVLRDLRQRFPDDTEVAETLAFFYLGRNDPIAAKKEFSAMLEKFPEDTRMINGMGAFFYDEAEYEKAADYFKRAIEIDPYFAAFHANLGWALVKQEPHPELDEAERACAAALKRERRYTYAFGCLGLIAFKRGRLREAEDFFLSSIEAEKKQGRYADLGALYVLMGRYDEAEQMLKDAVKFKKDDPQPRLELANLYLQTNRAKEAVRECRRVIAIAPNSESAPRALAIALIGADDYREAEKILREAIRKQDESKRWRLHLTLSQLLTRLGDKTSDDDLYGEALKEVQIAIRIKPNAPELFFQKGILRSKAKDPRGALKDFNECVRLDENNYEAERYARLVSKQISEDIHRGSKIASGSVVGLGFALLFVLWFRFFVPGEPTAPAVNNSQLSTPSAIVATVAKTVTESVQSATTAPPSASPSKSPVTASVMTDTVVRADSSKPTAARVSETMLTVMTPLLLGMIVVGFMLPALVRLKFAGVEAELTQPKEVISTGPKGEVSLGGSLSTIK
jgi:tetratricopeptide (TPR) repeat protein